MYDILERNNGRKSDSREHSVALENILGYMNKLVLKSVARKADEKKKLLLTFLMSPFYFCSFYIIYFRIK